MNYSLPPPPPPPPAAPIPARLVWGDGILERTLYETCDALHQVIERLQILPRPIHRLKVSIFVDQYDKREPVLDAAQLFLNSFRDLRNVVNPTVDSVTWVTNSWEYIDLLNSPTVLPVSSLEVFENSLEGQDDIDRTFAGIVKRWKAGIHRPGPAPDVSPVVYAYWILHHVCFDLQAHHEAAKIVESNARIYELLLGAKKAREAEDMAALRVISQEIQGIWERYQEKQRMFERRVQSRVQFVDGLVNWDEMVPRFAPVNTSTPLQEYKGKGKGRAKDINDFHRGDPEAGASRLVKEEPQW